MQALHFWSMYTILFMHIYIFLRINTIFFILNNVLWIKGFPRKIEITNSFIAELWGLRDGLVICSNYNFDCVGIELDVKAIIDVLANPNYVNNTVSPILGDCRQLIANIPQVQFSHCYCEVNRCADRHARMGSIHNLDFVIFDSLLVDLLSVFEDNFNEMYLNKLCPKIFVLV